MRITDIKISPLCFCVVVCLLGLATVQVLGDGHEDESDLLCEIDLVIILDDSGSICDNDPVDPDAKPCGNWRLAVGFAQDIIRHFGSHIDKGFTRIGLILFSSSARAEWTLDKYKTTTELIDATEGLLLKYQRGTTHTDKAIALLLDPTKYFPSGPGVRPNVPNVALIITDGIPHPPEREALTLQLAKTAQDTGIIMFSLGITASVDEEVLAGLSSEPRTKDKTYFIADSFTSLINITNIVVDATCKVQAACSDMDIVFILDASGSIRRKNFDLSKEFLAELILNLDVDNGATRVGLITFSDDPEQIIELGEFKTGNETADAVDKATWIGGKTSVGNAMMFVTDEMLVDARENVLPVIVILTDGGSQDKPHSFAQSKRAKEKATVLVVEVGNWLDKYELTGIASYPKDKTMYHAKSYKTMNTLIPELKTVLCNGGQICEDGLCQNSGVCVNDVNMHFCDCPIPFGGHVCEFECRVPGNIVFALDVSGSIGQANFMKVVDFVHKVAEMLPLGEAASTGFLTWGTEVEPYVELKKVTTKRALLNAMSMPLYKKGKTFTAAAIEYATTMFTPSVCGSTGCLATDPGSRAVLVLVSDGRSASLEETWAAAQKAREAGIVVITFGIGQSVRISELRMIGSYPGDNVFLEPSYDKLMEHSETIHDAICDKETECDVPTCENGGTCVELTNGYSCQCPNGNGGYNCEMVCNGKRDVVIVLDKSGSIRNNMFLTVKEFLVKIMLYSEWNEEKLQFAMVSFGEEALVEFTFNQFAQRQDQVEAVRAVRYQGNRTDVGAALKVVREEIFVADNGYRPDATPLVLLYSDAAPTMNPETLIPEAEKLRGDGAKILAVGVGENLHLKNMNDMSDKAAPMKRFAELTDDVAYGLAETLCSMSEP